MITGVVSASLDARIRLTVRDSDGLPHEIDAVIDTGFNGSLTLPPTAIAQLGLPWRTYGSVILANGSVVNCDVHAATVVWEGDARNVLVETAESDPLVGMALMRGSELRIEVVEDGGVWIQPIVR